jgi:ribosomal protein L29
MQNTNPFLGMSVRELQGMITEERAKLRDMTVKLSVGQFRTVRQMREVKKRIARLETQISTLKTS